MTKHNRHLPQLVAYRQDAREARDNSCYLFLACISRRICKLSIILLVIVLLLVACFSWIAHLVDVKKTPFQRQVELNQQRYLDGRWHTTNTKVLSVFFQGRLGNELFQYAAVFCEARAQKLRPVIPTNQELWGIFSISAEPVSVARLGMMTFRRVREKLSCAFDPAINKLDMRHNVQLYGYYQSWKYCHDHAHELRREFQFANYLVESALTFLIKKLNERNVTTSSSKLVAAIAQVSISSGKKLVIPGSTKSVTLVGIHVRQGDMVHDPQIVNYGYVTPNISYYNSATNYFRRKYKNVLFVVCSDEPKWVKRHMNYQDMVLSEGNNKEIDMTVLSLCDHTIISIGSFGWWSAWLANGEVLYYKDWPRANSTLDTLVNKTDYFPPSWIPMS